MDNYHIVLFFDSCHRLCEEGTSLARFLTISGKKLTVRDMLVTGMVTHIVGEEPHNSFCSAFESTMPQDDSIKWKQPDAVDPTTAKEILVIVFY